MYVYGIDPITFDSHIHNDYMIYSHTHASTQAHTHTHTHAHTHTHTHTRAHINTHTHKHAHDTEYSNNIVTCFSHSNLFILSSRNELTYCSANHRRQCFCNIITCTIYCHGNISIVVTTICLML